MISLCEIDSIPKDYCSECEEKKVDFCLERELNYKNSQVLILWLSVVILSCINFALIIFALVCGIAITKKGKTFWEMKDFEYDSDSHDDETDDKHEMDSNDSE